MGETNPSYPVMEVALALFSKPDLNSKERIQEGDIVDVRDLSAGGIGMKEANTFLWLRIEGLEANDMSALSSPLEENGVLFDKRRHTIPLDRLKVVYPSLDLSRSRDDSDLYQPFYLVDEESFEFLSSSPVFDVSGLVFDKSIGSYI